jgi:hypothetical protein
LKKLSLTIFTNNFITTLLGISPMKLGKKEPFSHIGPKKRSQKITVKGQVTSHSKG